MKKIMLMLAPAMLLLLSFNSTVEHTVKGVITDEKGKPVSFASVMVKSAKKGVQADAAGTYSINVADKNATLVFSAAGYQTKQIQIKGRNQINVVLNKAKQELKEVVVTQAFGTKRTLAEKTDNVSSVLAGKALGLTLQTQTPMTYAWSGNASTAIGTFSTSNGRDEEFNTEGYDNIQENTFLRTTDNPLSTFSIDVDAASYSNVRRMLHEKQLPPAGAVRIEEMINYFHYDYPQPKGDAPFSFTTEISDCPWNPHHKLAVIGMQGKTLPVDNLPASNLVFLIDVSGSMYDENKLPLVKSSLKLLTDQLREQDMVSIVVYAGAAGLVLPATSGANKSAIKAAIDQLTAGGSTAGGAGIQLAYKTANANFRKGGNNRVILCTDGDFNVGMSSDDEMERLIEKERNTGIYLTVLGYGMGNYKDSKMQKLADKGNGNHAYIDGMNEAKKVLVNEFGGTLFTIAKDVKLQLEFNPARVQGYRLVGYENRMLKKEDFNDDKKDAGDLGSGHTVTALYEIIPAGASSEYLKPVDPLKYQDNRVSLDPVEGIVQKVYGEELMTIKFRYKAPDGDISKLIVQPVLDKQVAFANASENFRFAATVAEFGMLLRNSAFKDSASYDNVLLYAKNAIKFDKEKYRSEFIELVETARSLSYGVGKVD